MNNEFNSGRGNNLNVIESENLRYKKKNKIKQKHTQTNISNENSQK